MGIILVWRINLNKMVVTNYGKNRIILFLGGSSTYIPSSVFIGKGSGISLVTDTTLISGTDAQLFTTTSYPTSYKTKWQADWNSVEMSGIQLTEYGIGSGIDAIGSVWSRTSIPSLTFDGTNELRIETVWNVY